MSTHDNKPNVHAFDLSDWPEQDDEEIRDRRLGLLSEEVRMLRESVDRKFDQLVELAKLTRGDIKELNDKWVRILDRQLEQAKTSDELDKRVVDIETRRPKKRK